MKTVVLNNRKDRAIDILIDECKSSKMNTGVKLRDVHYKLGSIFAPEIISGTCRKDFAVLVLMRAGLMYALGIADRIEKLGCTVSLIFIDNDVLSEENLSLIKEKEIIIVDAVVNTGRSIFNIIKQLSKNTSVKVTTTVIPEKSLYLFEKVQLYTVRTSNNQYTGAKVKTISQGKGPDTGDRLFNTM